ncbi:hypothetical protein GPECTOR_46g221 [Gonium pectorale]|uniref:EfeO-type cupredoxin-like domain-containing protein n=1 Tax=Gonium pectorale TaxID=33097 RepID=A0A150G8H8_GONPE|nr:hypothetical protein GPECTOR_46g221 [Gonium pectorale]|eukprot:KXZ46152.1 hypothetical protein GPECTOR_46g221 [Gonium pectorale]
MQSTCRLAQSRNALRHSAWNLNAKTVHRSRIALRAVRDTASGDAASTPSPLLALTASRREALGVLGGSVLALTAALAVPPAAEAGLKDYNLVDPEAPIDEVSVQLGTRDGQLVFTPSTLEFTQGRITKLKLSNPSEQTHYFTALEFATKIYTIQLLAGEPAVEVKGAISELELKGGASATWVFVPMKPGKYPLRCTKKGHDAMLGTLVVKRAA